MHHLVELVERFGAAKIALIGDFMLDKYLYGDTERISPEAPVPVLRVVGSECRCGGAGSVAANVLALGGKVRCVGVIGQDSAGEELLGKLTAIGAETSTITRLPGRATTCKQRLVGIARHRHRQQMLRLDEEAVEPLPGNVQASLRASLRSALADCKVVAMQDYGKGVFNDLDTPQWIADARAAGAKVIVDPAAIRDYRRYRGASVLLPNRYEASLASGVEIAGEDSLARCARRLCEAAGAEAVVITMDADGAYLAAADGQGRMIPTRRRAVYDVTGAGDAVLAMLAVATAEGCDLADATALANVVGGLAVERFGAASIGRDALLEDMRRTLGLRSGKVLSRERLAEEVARRRQRGDVVVFTNGCFDLLHLGHIRYLQEARRLGSLLVVGVNTDDSVRRLKGPTRPVINEAERAEVLSALECVDYVTLFDEDTPAALVEQVRPDFLVKGADTKVIVGQEFVESYGGKVLRIKLVDGLSTTTIIGRILQTHDAK